MTRLIVVLAMLMCFRPATLRADDGPEALLSQILASDFSDDPQSRYGHVFYRDGRSIAAGCVNEECAERRETFDGADDPLVIITRWQIVDVRMEKPTKALVTVRSRVIATADGQNEKRKIVPLAEPRDEEMVYQVWKRKGHWLWVDPPILPRVGYTAVRRAVAERQVDELKDLIAARGPGPNGGWERLLPLYQAELAALDALRPVAEANSAP